MMLINNSEQLSAIVGSNISNNFAAINPALVQAEEEHIKPAIGTVYALLLAQTTLSAFQLRIKTLLQNATAFIAYSTYSDIGQLMITDKGFHKVRSEREWVASESDLFKANAAFSKRGFNYLEIAVAELVANAKSEQPDAIVAGYLNCAEHNEFFNTFFAYTKDFAAFEPIADRTTLAWFKPILIDLKTKLIEANITKALCDEVLTELVEHSLTENNKALLPYIQKALVNHVLLQASTKYLFKVTPHGLLVTGYKNENSNLQQPNQVEQVKGQLALKQLAASSLVELRTFLNTYADGNRYSQYFRSNLYNAPGSVIETNNAKANAKTWRGY